MSRIVEKLRIPGLGALTMDGILFALLVGGYAVAVAPRLESTTSAVVLLLALGAIASYLTARNFRTRLFLAYAAIAAIAIAPMMLGIYLRHISAPFEFAHDGMIQTEEAVKFLLAGKNPYAENYLDTPLAQWWVPGPGEPVNPALYHFVYLPFLVVFSTPFYIAAQSTINWFDERMIFLPLFAVLCLLIPRLARSRKDGLALMLLVCLNPLFVPFLAEGRNDVFVLFWIVLSVILLRSDRRVLSAIALAFACATKETAWFIVPFYAIYCLSKSKSLRLLDKVSQLIIPCVVSVSVFAAIVLPFFLWNPSAFIDDVYSFVAGTTEFIYPVRSLGFGGIALAVGWIRSSTDTFPFGILQLAFGLPALILLCWFQFTENSIKRVWLCYGVFTLVIGFFSRVFNDNHLGYILMLFALWLLSSTSELPQPQTLPSAKTGVTGLTTIKRMLR